MTAWGWPDGARLALSLVVNVEEGAEMSVAEGDKGPEPVDELGVAPKIPIRNFGNEGNYRYGLTEGAPRVLRLLDEHGVHASWTAAAQALERAPWLARAIVARGDEVVSHGWRWVHTFSYDEERERAFIRRASDSILATCGARPRGWLSRYLHTERTPRLLLEEGFSYHMDDYSADAPFWRPVTMPDGSERGLLIVPYAMDSNDMKFWLAPGYRPADWLDYAIDTFEWLYAEGASAPRMMSLGVHLRIIGRPGRIGAYAKFLAHVAARPGVWITTRAAIAAHFAGLVPFAPGAATLSPA
jgi:peptidoglycan/xylan/chitin deacetylase (PgdA/CDA1 family)